MNRTGERDQTLEEFLTEWDRATADRTYEPTDGDSSDAAAARFLDAVAELAAGREGTTLVVVTHGGVTVDALRTLAGDAQVRRVAPELLADGVPNCAITRLSLRTDGPQRRRMADIGRRQRQCRVTIGSWRRRPA